MATVIFNISWMPLHVMYPCYISIPGYSNWTAACGTRKHGHCRVASNTMPTLADSQAMQGCQMSAPLQFYLVQDDLATAAQHRVLHNL